MQTEIYINSVVTGLGLCSEFSDGSLYQHHGHAIDAPEYICTGASYGYTPVYGDTKNPVSMPKCCIRGLNAFIDDRAF